jgi:hypothetical protein
MNEKKYQQINFDKKYPSRTRERTRDLANYIQHQVHFPTEAVALALIERIQRKKRCCLRLNLNSVYYS